MSLSTQEATSTISAFIARHRWLLTLIMLGIGLYVAISYGHQALTSIRHLIEGTQPIVRPWMTIPRVSQQFKIPEEELYRALAVQPQRPDPRPLDKLARDKGLMPHIFVEQVQRFVNKYHQAHPAPPQPPSPLSFLSTGFFWLEAGVG